MIAASMAGAAVFAALTGFGQNVRTALPLTSQLDAVLAAGGLAINQVIVTGHAKTLESEVFRALGPLDRSIVSLDMAAARQRIEALPWVETAMIKRVLPDKVAIAITERRPVAVWQDGAAAVLVDRSGRRLASAGSHAPTGLLQISGADAASAVDSLLEALARHPAVASRIRQAEWRGRRRWDLELDGGLRVKLAADRAEISLRRLAALERSHAALLDRAGTVDLRLPDAIAVAPAPRTGRQAAPHAPRLGQPRLGSGGARG